MGFLAKPAAQDGILKPAQRIEAFAHITMQRLRRPHFEVAHVFDTAGAKVVMKWLPKLLASPAVVSDEEAMGELQARGDHAAFTLLMRHWESPIRRLCIRMTGNEHRGEELSQETFARVFVNRHQYTAGRKFSTWLWRIALNLCFEEGRRASRRGEWFFDPDLELKPALYASEPTPVERLIGRERAELVREALSRISEAHRSVVILREYEGLKYREIAEVLEIPEGTVKWRMAEALTQLSELLGPLSPKDDDQNGARTIGLSK